jgi:hypothetical protein
MELDLDFKAFLRRHPDFTIRIDNELLLSQAAVAVHRLEIEDSDVKVDVTILDTPEGRQLQELIRSGCAVSFNFMGRGTLRDDGLVGNDYCFDGIGVSTRPKPQP